MASKTNPITFFQQVRAETAKVTWPTRRETVISTIMVVIMAFLAAAFFFLADQLMAYGVEFILALAAKLGLGSFLDDGALVHRSRLFQF
ncbi:preprotein translocase subunit SecE [Brucella abortus]|uniref:preprotein translocase subunit SecE n=1 Tax=Brucella abortus TaxID=235 RepID=UPI001EEF1960|nr:preprotein translocase subunit SecE [Brucella abortus]